MMQSANPITKKTGISMAPRASFVCVRWCSWAAVSMGRSSVMARVGLATELDVAVDLSHRVAIERFGRGTVEHRSGQDVKPGAVALAHERRPCQQASRERA